MVIILNSILLEIGSQCRRARLPTASRKKNLPVSKIINPLLTKFVRSRWVDIVFLLYLRVYGTRPNRRLISIDIDWFPISISVDWLHLEYSLFEMKIELLYFKPIQLQKLASQLSIGNRRISSNGRAPAQHARGTNDKAKTFVKLTATTTLVSLALEEDGGAWCVSVVLITP